MKQLLLVIFIGIVTGSACTKEKPFTYHADDNIYFDFDPASDRDSIVYTFAYSPGLKQDTVFLPVRISGIREKADRTFSIRVISKGTTAQEGLHYEALKPSYTMPADSGVYHLPLVLFNTDPLLTQQSVAINFQLLPGNGLDTAINELITGKVVFSNKLEKPDWWQMWLGGYYSQVKHELFLITSGATELTMDGLDAPKNLYHVGRLTSFLNDPFTWITNNPDKHYVLEQRTDGNYDFYKTDIPSKKILYRENTQNGKFYFIDENGLEVI